MQSSLAVPMILLAVGAITVAVAFNMRTPYHRRRPFLF
jgi:hypothetical protein